eukprot:5063592-Amphidinium_carterae.1
MLMAPKLEWRCEVDRNRASCDFEIEGDSQGSLGHWAEECLTARHSTEAVELSVLQEYGMQPAPFSGHLQGSSGGYESPAWPGTTLERCTHLPDGFDVSVLPKSWKPHASVHHELATRR